MEVRKAIIPVAGFGVRLLPATRAIPKALLPVLDTPALQLAIEEAVDAGIERVAIVTSPDQAAIGAHFGRIPDLEDSLRRAGNMETLDRMLRISSLADIAYIHQRERRGPGHAVLAARAWVGAEAFAVLLPDDVIRGGSTLRRLIEVYRQTEGPVLAVADADDEDIPRKGVISPRAQHGDLYDIGGVVEKPSLAQAPSNLAIVGRYVLPAETFDILETTPPGAGGEIQLTDAIAELLKTHRARACRVEGELFDAGVPSGLLMASIREALEREDMADEVLAFIRRAAAAKATTESSKEKAI